MLRRGFTRTNGKGSKGLGAAMPCPTGEARKIAMA